MENNSITKQIIITVEERLNESGTGIIQNVNIEKKNIGAFEALGLLRLFEQRTSLELLQNPTK